MNKNTKDKIKEIKQSFRLMMNGTAAQSMRDKGLDYHLNWGVPFVELKRMGAEIGKDYDLAIELWKEDIRECKILATLVMPAEKMPVEIAEIWMEQTRSQEMAEMQAFNLYQYVDYAPVIAYRWMAHEGDVYQICAYDILSRLFMKGQEPNERGIHEFLDQAIAALQSGSMGVKHTALNAVNHFAGLGVMYERVAQSALKKQGLDLL
ncbi:MAG: DNA alkylation repair protein [Prevotella sp.]|nr:DNA alkylation repair protein [Prevotella sp.]